MIRHQRFPGYPNHEPAEEDLGGQDQAAPQDADAEQLSGSRGPDPPDEYQGDAEDDQGAGEDADVAGSAEARYNSPCRVDMACQISRLFVR
jgi:hypothetical protein